MKPNSLTLDRVAQVTENKLSQKMSAIRYAFKLLDDPEKKERREKCLCVVCFYGEPYIVGHMMTEKPCDSCQTNMVFSSTRKDCFCKDCAKKYKLCKHCGCEMNLQLGRLKQLEGL